MKRENPSSRGWEEVARLEEEIKELRGELDGYEVSDFGEANKQHQHEGDGEDDEDDEQDEPEEDAGFQGKIADDNMWNQKCTSVTGNKYDRDAVFDEEVDLESATEDLDVNFRIEDGSTYFRLSDEDAGESQDANEGESNGEGYEDGAGQPDDSALGKAHTSNMLIQYLDNSIFTLSSLFQTMMKDPPADGDLTQVNPLIANANNRRCQVLAREIDQLESVSSALKLHEAHMIEQLRQNENADSRRLSVQEIELERQKLRSWEQDVQRQADALAQQSTTITAKSAELQALKQDRHRLLLDAKQHKEHIQRLRVRFEEEKSDMLDFFAKKLHRAEMLHEEPQGENASAANGGDEDDDQNNEKIYAEDKSNKQIVSPRAFQATLSPEELSRYLHPQHRHSILPVSPAPFIKANSSIAWLSKAPSQEITGRSKGSPQESRKANPKNEGRSKNVDVNGSSDEAFCSSADCLLKTDEDIRCHSHHHYRAQTHSHCWLEPPTHAHCTVKNSSYQPRTTLKLDLGRVVHSGAGNRRPKISRKCTSSPSGRRSQFFEV